MDVEAVTSGRYQVSRLRVPKSDTAGLVGLDVIWIVSYVAVVFLVRPDLDTMFGFFVLSIIVFFVGLLLSTRGIARSEKGSKRRLFMRCHIVGYSTLVPVAAYTGLPLSWFSPYWW